MLKLFRSRFFAFTLFALLVGAVWGGTATYGVALAEDVATREHAQLERWDGVPVLPGVVVASLETQTGEGYSVSLWAPTWSREVLVHWTRQVLCVYTLF